MYPKGLLNLPSLPMGPWSACHPSWVEPLIFLLAQALSSWPKVPSWGSLYAAMDLLLTQVPLPRVLALQQSFLPALKSPTEPLLFLALGAELLGLQSVWVDLWYALMRKQELRLNPDPN